jgi:CRISPR-associated endonuclease Cas1
MPAANTGVKIMRFLLTRKLEGQADNAERILRDNATAKFILEQTDKLAVAKDVNTLMGYEGEAAKRYWAAWGDLPVIWNGPKPLQSHWLAFPKRATLRRDYADNRNATDPINAMLNFGYACAESECTLAAYAAALDPAMGIGHVDEPGRNSFALDLIEVLRPFVDAIILGIMAEKLDRDHYAENKVGVVSCRVPLTHRIASEVHAAAIEVTKALFTVLPLLDSHQSRKAGIKSDSD